MHLYILLLLLRYTILNVAYEKYRVTPLKKWHFQKRKRFLRFLLATDIKIYLIINDIYDSTFFAKKEKERNYGQK